jgi:hypothetical protein
MVPLADREKRRLLTSRTAGVFRKMWLGCQSGQAELFARQRRTGL